MPSKSAAATAASFTAPSVDEKTSKTKRAAPAPVKSAPKPAVTTNAPPAPKPTNAATPKPEPRRGIPIMFVRFTMQLEFGEWLEQIRPNRPIGYELELVGNLLHVRWEDRNTKVRELVLVPTSMIRSMRAFPEKPAKTE